MPKFAPSSSSTLKLNNLAKLQSKLSSDSAAPTATGDPVCLPLEAIVVATHQPRRYFSVQELEKLKVSLKTQGLLNPLIVRPKSQGQYELVAGERRYRAAKELGWTEIAVRVMELDELGAVQISLIENLQREDLNPLEQTEGILVLLTIRLERSQEEVLKILYRLHNEQTGKVATKNVFGSEIHQEIEKTFNELGQLDWLSFVVCRLPLLNLPQDVLDVLRQGKIAYTKARAIAKLKEPEVRQSLLTETIEHKLSLAQVKEKIRQLKKIPADSRPISSTSRERWKTLNKKIMSSQIWNDPQACRQLEDLLEQIESLVVPSR